MSDVFVSRLMKRYRSCDRGSAAIEYGIIAMAMFVALIPAFIYVASDMGVKFQSITDFFGSFG